MKKFNVFLRRSITQEAMVVIEAENADAAGEIALENAGEIPDDDWDYDDDDTDVSSVEEVV